MLEQGRIVTWLDRNSEYADDLDAVQELLDGATLITINANLFKTKLRIFAEDTKSRYAPFFKSSARVADLKKHLAGIADADKRSDRKTFLAAMSAVLLKTQQRSFSVLFAKLATASSVDGNDPLKALKWGLDAYFWEGAHAIWGYEGEHTFDALMTWLFVMNARGWDYRHNSAQRDFSTWTHDVATRDDARRWAKRVDEATGASSALRDAATDSLLIDTTTPGVDRELISRLVCGIIDGSVGVAQVEEQRERRRKELWFDDTKACGMPPARGHICSPTCVRSRVSPSRTQPRASPATRPRTAACGPSIRSIATTCAPLEPFTSTTSSPTSTDTSKTRTATITCVPSRARGMTRCAACAHGTSPFRRPVDASTRSIGCSSPARTGERSSSSLTRSATRPVSSSPTSCAPSDEALRSLGRGAVSLGRGAVSLGRGAVSVNPWYTMLPSITALGMAALLPHRELTLGVRGKDQVVVETDGQSTAGIDARRTILEGTDGRAFTYEELKQDTIKVMRSKFKGTSAVYIYHDVIDATGDHAASESGTPDAVNRAIDELSALVSKLISADITRILVTADHGFLFQDSEPANDDTAKQGGVPRGRSISVKKRRGRPRRRHRPALRRHVPEGQPFQPPRHPTRAHQPDAATAHRHD